MADPVVHITLGVPDSGTGNITTLGQTIPPAGTATASVLGGNLVQGAVTTAAPVYINGQVDPLSLTTAGLLRVDGSGVTQPISGSITVSGTTTVSGTVTANQGGTWTVQPGNTANTTAWLVTGTGGTFPVTGTFWQATQPVSGTVTANQGGAPWSQNQTQLNGVALGSPSNYGTSPGAISVQGVNAFVTNSVAVTGTFWQATQPVSIAATVNVSAAQSGTWTVQQGTPPWLVGGDVANAATDGGNPVKIGGVAKTGNPVAVADGQRVNAVFDKQGKMITTSAIRQLKGVQKTSITVNTEQIVVTAGAATVFQDVYAIIVTNKSATPVSVDFRDASAGTVRMTLAAPANDTRGFTVTVDSAMVQAVAANNWTATVSSAVTSIEITMLYVSNL